MKDPTASTVEAIRLDPRFDELVRRRTGQRPPGREELREITTDPRRLAGELACIDGDPHAANAPLDGPWHHGRLGRDVQRFLPR